MQKVTHYTTIAFSTLEQLDKAVYESITQRDWTPQGGVAIDPDDRNRKYVQAMVKYEERQIRSDNIAQP